MGKSVGKREARDREINKEGTVIYMHCKLSERKWFVYGLVPVVALLWGLSFLWTSAALETLDVMEVLALRWTVAAVLFLVLTGIGVVEVSYKGKNIKNVLAVGLTQPCIYAIFEALGVKYTTASESSIFIATIPLIVLIVGGLFLKEKTGKLTAAAIVIAFAGVVICVMFSPGFSLGSKGIGYLYLTIAVIVGAMFSFASSRASSEFGAIEITFTISMMGAVFFNAANLLAGNGFRAYAVCFQNFDILSDILFLGVGCSCICYLIYNFVLAKLPPAVGTNLVASSVTAIGVLSGCFIAGDPFGWYTVVGVTLTITGVCLSSAGSTD